MAVKWDDHMLGSLIIEDRVLPPLEGIGEIIRSEPTPPPAQNQKTGETPDKLKESSSFPIGLIVVLSVLAIMVFSSFYQERKSN